MDHLLKILRMKIFDQWGRSVHETNNKLLHRLGMQFPLRASHNLVAWIYALAVIGGLSLDNEDSFIRKRELVNLIR